MSTPYHVTITITITIIFFINNPNIKSPAYQANIPINSLYWLNDLNPVKLQRFNLSFEKQN